jgi:hypothetical protein
MSESSLTVLNITGSHQGNLLNAAVRRDIADLNRLFLTHAMDPVHRADSWFQLPAATLQQFERAPPEAIERAVRMPVALFELVFPEPVDAADWRAGAVGDAERHSGDQARDEIRRAFGLVVLSVARRLAEGVPFAARIAFGLSASIESRLSSLSPSETFRLASWQELVRPRWPSHARFWNMLTGAAAGSRKEDLSWAYSAGLCLLGQCERAPATLRYAGTERRPRPTHRRVRTKGTDVPC